MATNPDTVTDPVFDPAYASKMLAQIDLKALQDTNTLVLEYQSKLSAILNGLPFDGSYPSQARIALQQMLANMNMGGFNIPEMMRRLQG